MAVTSSKVRKSHRAFETCQRYCQLVGNACHLYDMKDGLLGCCNWCVIPATSRKRFSLVTKDILFRSQAINIIDWLQKLHRIQVRSRCPVQQKFLTSFAVFKLNLTFAPFVPLHCNTSRCVTYRMKPKLISGVYSTRVRHPVPRRWISFRDRANLMFAQLRNFERLRVLVSRIREKQ